ncbi:MAG: hypothetical protein ACRC8S_05100 [Fimbriiglobus sp.]
MKNEVIRAYILDSNYESYKSFYDSEWAKSVSSASLGNPIEKPLDSFLLACRQTNGCYLLPWLMVEQIRCFSTGKSNGHEEFRKSYASHVVTEIYKKVIDKMQESLTLSQKSALKRTISKLEAEAFQNFSSVKNTPSIDAIEYWNDISESVDFRFSILGIQKSSFASLYFAYEDFLAGLMRIKEPAFGKKKGDRFDDFFPCTYPLLKDDCWLNDDIKFARLVRNAIAHFGGFLTDDLKKHYGDKIRDFSTSEKVEVGDGKILRVIGEEIQIVPSNTRYLFDVLKRCVSKIVEAIARETLVMN